MKPDFQPTLYRIVRRAHRGAKSLDRRMPGWEDKISLEKLSLESPFQCVLGQLGNVLREGTNFWAVINFADGCKYPALEPLEGLGLDEAVRLGFTLPSTTDYDDVGNSASWGHLDGAWREEIRARQDNVKSTLWVLAKRVHKGAKWLDETLPGWVDRIEIDALDLEQGSACVLGQLANSLHERATYNSVMNFRDGCAIPTDGLAPLALAGAPGNSMKMGFALPPGSPGNSWATLNDLWQEEILDRKTT